MKKSVLLLLGLLCVPVFAQDVNFDGVIDSKDLFALSRSWHVFLTQERALDLLDDWQVPITYQPPKETLTLQLTPEGNEPQVYTDKRDIARIVYVKRIPKLAPDNTTVMTPQLAYRSVLPSGDYWQEEVILTDRIPDLKIFGSYFAPLLADLVMVGSKNKEGDFFAIWPHYSSGFSMVRFNSDGIPLTREYRTETQGLESIKRADATLDDDGNIHIAWTTPIVLNATVEIRYSKFTPKGQMLIKPPVALGTRPTASGSSEIFCPVIRPIGGQNMLVLIDQGESSPTVAVRVNGTDGTIIETTTLSENFVEPDFLELANGDIAMVAMIFVLSKGRDVFYTVLNPNLTTKVAPKNLSGTVQQSDGASIAVVEDDFYVAWNENSDNYMRLVRLNANGSRQGSVVKLSGPGQGFPYRLRLDSGPLAMAHVVYADGKGSIPALLAYEKRKIQ